MVHIQKAIIQKLLEIILMRKEKELLLVLMIVV
jgi:hypothetical protein